MNREEQNRVLGAVISLTYSLYPIEMTEERNALVRRALAALGEDCTAEQLDALLFDLHQSKYDLNPGCQCLFGKGYYPDDFTDNFRKLDRQDETGEAARTLFAALQTPHPGWDAALMYSAIRAIYNTEYEVERIEEIRARLIG
ncbi:hypothetical protein [Butyricicoccus sp.]|uniref:hypothetical protein n=1 Tax=Butyricicoccus sp. TaxID=2049021 RepID=UPI003F17ADC9